ncbi:MAG: MATE family efflux transporter, partial [Spirochaetia bacterium]|nr:MATE family efflux transporter [Spirochaetia bacterium]
MTETRPRANAFLAKEPIGKLLLKFSVPCVLSMLVSTLYNIIDQIFIGQSVGYLGNAATNVVFPFTVIAVAVAGLIGDGSAALFSLSLGGRDEETSHKCIGNGIVITVISGIAITIIGFLFTDKLLRLFGVTEASYT